MTGSMHPIIKKKQLTVEELKTLSFPMKIQGNQVIIEKVLRNSKLRHAVVLNLDKVLAAREKGLVAYILNAFIGERSTLLNFVFDNCSLIKMARHFLRHCSGSFHSCYTYVAGVKKYETWLSYSPDMIIADVKPVGNIPDPVRVQNHTGFLNDYLAELQDQGLKFGAINNYIKAVKTFYRVNNVKIDLVEPLRRSVTYKDRAPKPEELAKLLDIADLREKVILSCLALGAFRESTLVKLKYRHVRKDLENNITPVHVHVECEITKGKYGDSDTFLGAEAAQYLKLYMEDRKIGNVMDKTGRPPETLTDESPIIRSASSYTPKSITTKQIRKIVHALYLKAGLIKQGNIRFYDLRVHSLRKYFKTNLTALGVQPDFIDYWMGHVSDTYFDVQSLGVETLRKAYQAAGLCIRKKTQVSKIEALKEIIRAYGMNPEQILTQKALAEGATTYRSPEDYENDQLTVLREELRQLIQQTTTGVNTEHKKSGTLSHKYERRR